jgi:hypothetical protein
MNKLFLTANIISLSANLTKALKAATVAKMPHLLKDDLALFHSFLALGIGIGSGTLGAEP